MICSLLLGDPESRVGDLEALFSSDALRVTEGDLLTLRMLLMSRTLIDKKTKISNQDSSSLEGFALSTNPIEQLAALVIYSSYEAAPEAEMAFYGSFRGLEDELVAKQITNNLSRGNNPQRENILRMLINSTANIKVQEAFRSIL